MITPINFKAQYIKTTNIKELSNLRYKNKEVSFVELEKYDKDDEQSLKNIADKWEPSYAKDILENIDKNREISHVYVLTEQKDSFEYLEPEKILGVMSFCEYYPHNLINYIQTNPKYKHNSFDIKNLKSFLPNKYKNIGSSIITTIKSLFPNKPIQLFFVDESLKKFYRKLDFKQTNPYTMVWTPQKTENEKYYY